METRENAHVTQLFYLYKPRANSVVDIVIVVGDGIGQVCELRFEPWLGAIQESFAHVAEQARVLRGTMLEHTFPAFEREIQAGELGVALFELVDDSQGLEVVLE